MTKNSKNKNRSIFEKSGSPFFPASILFIIAVVWRARGSEVYYTVESLFFSAKRNISLFDPVNVFGFVLKQLFAMFQVFFIDYFIPVFFFLLPAILFLAYGFIQIGRKRIKPVKAGKPVNDEAKSARDLFRFVEDPENEKKFIVVIMAVALLSCTLANLFLFKNFPTVGDEFSYFFQADLLADGKLYAETPPMEQFFRSDNIVVDDHWYSKYTIGWPLLLAIGWKFGVRWLIAPLCAAFSALLLYLSGKKLFGPKGGIIAVVMALFSPYFVLTGGYFFPHMAAGMCILLFLYFLLKTMDEESLINPVIAGVGIGYLLLIRPIDSALNCLGFLPFVLYSFVQSDKKAKLIPKFLIIIFILGLFSGVLLYTNKQQTGDPFTLAFQIYNPNEKLGFDSMGHTPVKGFWNVVITLMRNAFWLFPFLGVSAFFLVYLKKYRESLLIAPFLSFTVFYFTYYSLGSLEIGARFYFPGFVTLLVPAAGGVLYFDRMFFESKIKEAGGAFTKAFLIASALFMSFAVYPDIIRDIPRQYAYINSLMQLMTDPPNVIPPALVFIKAQPENPNNLYIRNFYDYEKQAKVNVLYLTPEENEKLIEMHPERRVYTIVYNEKDGTVYAEEGIDNERNAENYTAAALNYQNGVRDKDRAVDVFKNALEYKPEDPLICRRLGDLLFELEKFEEAAKYYGKSGKTGPYYNSLYLQARSLGMAGKYGEAVHILEEYLERSKDENVIPRARAWLEEYRKKAALNRESSASR